MDLTNISQSLSTSESGIWTPSNGAQASAISFPEEGHQSCFDIEDQSFWFAHRNECISGALRRFPFEGAFLDVGGGNGAVSARLSADGIETVVLEPGPEGAMNAQKRGIRTVVCATLEQAGFRPESFGAAGLFDVIEHVEDDAALLGGTRAALRQGGVLCVTVPAYEWLWSAEDEDAGHYRRYTLGRLEAVLARSGFAVQYATYFFAPLMLPLFVFRSLRYRLTKPGPMDLERAAQQHTPRPATRRAMDLCLGPEVRVIGRGGTIPFGTSCLAIALAR